MHMCESRLPITAGLLCALALSGCGTRPAPVPAQAPLDVSPTAGTEAKTVYTNALHALERKDDNALSAVVADRVCGPRGEGLEPSAWVQSHRKGRGGARSSAVQVVRASANEVVLADFGIWYEMLAEPPNSARPFLTSSDEPVAQGPRERLVVMRKIQGRWLIAADTPIDDPSCTAPDLGRPVPPPEYLACMKSYEADLRACDGYCSGAVPGHACFQCPEGALCSVSECLGVATIEEACTDLSD